ncbi:MAG: hypothetical protein ACOYMG_06850 [Candidatus Methylumidiphilus sp.]
MTRQTTKNRKPRKVGKPSGADTTRIASTPKHTPFNALCEAFQLYLSSNLGLSLVDTIKTDGFWNHAQTDQDTKDIKPFRYCVDTDRPRRVFYIDHTRGLIGIWHEKDPSDESEKVAREHEFLAFKARQLREIEAKAAERARRKYKQADSINVFHPCLARWKVGSYELKQLPAWERRILRQGGGVELVSVNDPLLVPMRDQFGRIWNLQALFPDRHNDLGRDRDFLPGGRIKGLFHSIGDITPIVYLAESYELAAALHEEVGHCAFVCFDKANFSPIAGIVLAAMPEAKLRVVMEEAP